MLKNLSLLLGLILAIVGAWGFFTNDVLGFSVNTLHNLVHLVSGLWLLWAALKDEGQLPVAAKTLGVVYLVVAVLGLINLTFVTDLLTLNSADNWLHLVLGVIFVYFGFMSKKA